MTWIKTVEMDEDARVKAAMEAQRAIYPQEYAAPVPSWIMGRSRNYCFTLTDSGCVVYSFSAFGR